jgi:hypothetical protein
LAIGGGGLKDCGGSCSVILFVVLALPEYEQQPGACLHLAEACLYSLLLLCATAGSGGLTKMLQYGL